jgi:glycosyltransferase involved in cell wall biosynthesis
VIEALGCGLPVAGFDTGSLAELVQGDAGRLTPYGANEWKLEEPDVPTLAAAVTEVLQDQLRFRRSAREQAEEKFNVDTMVNEYLNVLLG